MIGRVQRFVGKHAGSIIGILLGRALFIQDWLAVTIAITAFLLLRARTEWIFELFEDAKGDPMLQRVTAIYAQFVRDRV